MSSSSASTRPALTVYDVNDITPSDNGAYAFPFQKDLYAATATATKGGTGAFPQTSLTARTATRSVGDILDDTFYSYTGVPTWSAFQRIQKEGIGLRQQLQNGAAFEHAAVQPAVAPFLSDWARKLRAVQAGRTCARVSAADMTKARVAPPRRDSRTTSTQRSSGSISRARHSSTTSGLAATAASPVVTASVSSTAVDTSLEVDRELERTRESCAEGEEDGLLPLWDDIDATTRCSAAVLHALRTTVRAYYRALLHLVTLAEKFAGRWGHLSPKELKELQAAMAQEKKAHVPPDFIFSAFTNLNASECRLGNDVGDLEKCTRLEVLRLNRNPALTELTVLPPSCRVVMVCGCQLSFFLNTPAMNALQPPRTFAAVTTLGLAYNQLRNVKFIRSFPALAVLDVSFNYMNDMDAVVKDVSAHGTLVEVTLQGNPIALLDTYRHTIVRGCVRLDRLDRVAITSEERTLSFHKISLQDRSTAVAQDGSAPPQTAEAAATAAGHISGPRKSVVSALTLPALTGNGGDGEREEGAAGGKNRTLKPRRPSARRQSATSQITLSPATIADSALSLSLSDEQLRTTVAAEVELLVLRGLSSFESTAPTHTFDELLPTATLVYTLAGLDETNTGGSHAALGAGAASFRRSPHSSFLQPSSKRGKASGAADAGAAAGRLGTSPGTNAGGGGGGGKRVAAAAAAQPLYELTSHVRVEGCWGAAMAPDPTRVRREEEVSSGTRGVRVELDVALTPTAPNSPARGGRHGTGLRRTSSATASRLRKKVASAAGVGNTGGASSAASSNGNGAANGAAASLREPYILSGASTDGTPLSKHASLSDTGVYAAQLPLMPNLTAALQQPLVLHVYVEDTYRYHDSHVMKAAAETGGSAGTRANSANRNGGGGSAAATAGGGTAAVVNPATSTKPSPAASMSTSPFPEKQLMSVLAMHAKAKKDTPPEVVDDAVVERRRREIGVLRLNPFDLFTSTNADGGGSGGGMARMLPPSAGAGAGGGAAVVMMNSSSPGTAAAPLPESRVLYLRDAVMEADTHVLHEMEEELAQLQRQLREALQLYNAALEQYTDANAESRGGGDVATDSLPASIRVDNGSVGQTPLPSGRRTTTTPLLTTPASPPSTSISAFATPPLKSPSRGSRVSLSPQASALASQLHGTVKEQQGNIVRLAVRVLALQSRQSELAAATLSADARLSIGRGPPPPPANSAEAELDALRYRREAPATRKGRPQPTKSFRR